MSSALAKIAFAEITRARTAGLKIDSLKDTMMTLKLAGEIVGNARKELYALLRVEEHEKEKELDDLPELQEDKRKLMDFVFTIGGYHMLAMALNTFGVEPKKEN